MPQVNTPTKQIAAVASSAVIMTRKRKEMEAAPPVIFAASRLFSVGMMNIYSLSEYLYEYLTFETFPNLLVIASPCDSIVL